VQLRIHHLLPLLLIAAGNTASAQDVSRQAPEEPVDTSCKESTDIVRFRERIQQGDSSSEDALRDMAWNLLGDVTGAPDGPPGWLHWRLIDSARQDQAKRLSASEGITLTLAQSDELRLLAPGQDLSDAPVTVFINDASWDHIKDDHLDSRDKWEKYRSLGVHQIPEFHCGSTNIKATWRVVPKGYSLPLGVWAGGPESTGGQENTWSQWIQVDNGIAQSIYPGELYWNPRAKMNQNAQVSDFYSISPGPTVIVSLDGSNNNIAKRLQPGDTLVLVGLHIAVKRHADWFWATFWWNPDGVGDNYKRGMPAWMSKDPRWRHYAMNLDVTMKNTAGSKYHGAVFNPYLEGLMPGGPVTNCMGCHKNAAYPGFNFSASPKAPDAIEDFVLSDYVYSLGHLVSPGQ
jgi:hypothetical protein